MRKSIVCGMAILALLGMTVEARAEFHPFKLLRRGATNIVTAPLEIPKQTIASIDEGKEKTYHVSVWAFAGFMKGIAYTIGRMGSGMFDILTSNFDRNVDPLMTPEYVVDDWPACPLHKSKDAEAPAAAASDTGAMQK